jgi:hypothetical protein
MSPAAEKFIHEFDALPLVDRQKVLVKISRRAPHDLPAVDELVAAADQLIQELDRREQQ